MVAFGAALGLALATRWTSIPLAAYLAAAFAIRRGAGLRRAREWGLGFLAFVLVPGLVYLATYVPWLAEGHGLRDFAWLQQAMWNHHAQVESPHPYSSPWYSWPWLRRPLLLFFEHLGSQGESVRLLLAVGNPLLWWAAVPASVAVLARGLWLRDGRALFVAFGFYATWLAWSSAPLSLVFAHYFLDSMVWACLALGLLLDLALNTRWRRLAQVYLVLVGLAFLHFLPVVTAIPLPSRWFFAGCSAPFIRGDGCRAGIEVVASPVEC